MKEACTEGGFTEVKWEWAKQSTNFIAKYTEQNIANAAGIFRQDE